MSIVYFKKLTISKAHDVMPLFFVLEGMTVQSAEWDKTLDLNKHYSNTKKKKD